MGHNFTMEKFENGVLTWKMAASSIQWDSTSGAWKLNHYSIRTISGLQEELKSGYSIDTVIDMKPDDFQRKSQSIDLMNYSQLREFIEQERMKGSESVKFYEVEKHKRIAFPFASLVLTLIAVSVSSRKVRGGIGLHIAFGLGVTFLFILVQRVTETLAIYSNWDPGLAVWLPNIVFGVFGVFLVYKAPK
jgi:lipopolysaccharide export system permease protein